MAIVSFTLSEDGVLAFQNALACILKFSDDVSLETRKDRLVLTALNLSNSAYLSFTFATNRFFSKYNYEGNAQHRDKFFCVLYIRALLSVFRSRMGGDPSRERDRETSIERCDVVIDDGPGKKSRFIARIVYRNGITATHGLPFEVKAPTHARFNKDEAVNHWTIAPRTVRQMMDHFGPKIELVDINTDGDNVVNFTCFTENQYVKTEDFLSKPLHTSIAMEMAEFSEIEVQDKHHIIISVKDFRAVLQHAGITSGELSACYSNPGRPMKLSYNADGIICEFVLMTVGEKGVNGHQGHKKRGKATREARPALEAASSRDSPAVNENVHPAEQAPPPRARPVKPLAARLAQFQMRPPPIPPSTLRSESMFVTQDDDQWEPVNPEDEEEEDNARLEWDTSNEPNPSTLRISSHYNTQVEAPRNEDSDSLLSGLDPTQRLADVREFSLLHKSNSK